MPLHQRTAAVAEGEVKSNEQTGQIETEKAGMGEKSRLGWGRKSTSSWGSSMGSLAVMLFCPLLAFLFQYSCLAHDCSLWSTGEALLHAASSGKGVKQQLQGWKISDFINAEAAILWTVWVTWQFLLYQLLPARVEQGQPTPAGHTLSYRVNGWKAWCLSHVAFLGLLAVFGLNAGTFVTRNWMQLFWVANIAGWILSFLAYLKAWIAPTHRSDNKWSGSFWYDVYMGVEHNPRFTQHPLSFDWKLFFNGRPGICAWTLLNLCFTLTQYHHFGTVTNSMIILNLLQAVYVINFFRNEGWYVRTVDITHEHFGFYLAWGDLVWLPFMYTLQGLFLSTHPVQLSTPAASAILLLGGCGGVLLKLVNRQKDEFRKMMVELEQHQVHAEKGERKGDSDSANSSSSLPPPPGRQISRWGHTVWELRDHLIWGQPIRFLLARYVTGGSGSGTMSGAEQIRERQSYLLLSGWWGVARHLNYFGDLLLSLAMCLCCGFTHLLPYFYIVFMVTLLLHRIKRDDERCSHKYGAVWKEYCEMVRFKLCPFLY